MKLWYGSDLHADFWDGKVKPFTDLVDIKAFDGFLFAGDVGEWRDPVVKTILELCSDQGPVINIPGNHEFYGAEVTRTLDSMLEFPFSTCLIKDVYDFPELKVRIWGDTLWTNFGRNAENMAEAGRRMNDYQNILYNRGWADVFLKPEDTAQWNEIARTALVKAAREVPEGWRFIVMTHHAPTFLSIAKEYRAPTYMEKARINAAYANDMYGWMETNRVVPDVWIHGHIHERANYEIEIGGKVCRVVSNPHGYPKEISTKGFGDHYIEILEDRIVVV